LAYTWAIINAIHDGSLAASPTQQDSTFGLAQVVACPGVPEEVLSPERCWKDATQYRSTAAKLANLFRDNFKQFAQQVTPEVIAAGPRE
jgi:phosphoenolpyruvate carboxykinase (ATP)